MSSELEDLINLQELDVRIVQLQARADRVPQEIQDLDRTLEERRGAIEQARQKLQDKKKRSRQLEGEVEGLREKLSKYKNQLMEVKTNKEYQVMLHEISTTEEQIVSQEDEILEIMMITDEYQHETEQGRERLKLDGKKNSKKRKQLEQFASQSEDEIKKLRQERDQLQEMIPSKLIELYRKLLLAHNGMALAEAKDQFCQACHVKLRLQLYGDLRTNRKIVTCESCNRILYYIRS